MAAPAVQFQAVLVERRRIERDESRLARFGDRKVWMLDATFGDIERMRAHLGPQRPIEAIGHRLTEALEVIADRLVNLDEHLGMDPADKRWRYSDIAERGPYNTDLMINLSRAIVFLEILGKGGMHVFVVDDPGLLDCLAAAGARAGHRVCVDESRSRAAVRRSVAGLQRRLAGVVGRVTGIWRVLMRLRMVAALRRRRPVGLDVLRSADTLIMVWGQQKTFVAGRHVTTTEQLGRLPAILRAGGSRLAFLANVVTWLDAFDDVLVNATLAADPVLMLEDCIRPIDVIRAAVSRRPPQRVERLVLAGYDLTAVYAYELDHERWKWRPVLTTLYERVGFWLAANDVRPRTFIYGFENQSLEKAVIDGFRRFLPTTRLVGIQNAFFAENYLCFYPSRCEIARNLVPDFLVTTGEEATKQFARRGFPADRMLAAAVRYERVGPVGSSRRADTARPLVLCATAIGYDEALELAVKTARALRDRDDIDLLVNFHPVTSVEFRENLQRDLARLVGPTRCSIRYSPASIRSILGEAEIVVYNSSGASYEALAWGVPVVFVGRDCVFDFDKVATGMGLRCRTAEELARMIANLIARPAVQRNPDDLSTRLESCIAPVNAKKVFELIGASESHAFNEKALSLCQSIA